MGVGGAQIRSLITLRQSVTKDDAFLIACLHSGDEALSKLHTPEKIYIDSEKNQGVKELLKRRKSTRRLALKKINSSCLTNSAIN